jgi:hypothetical protein
MEISYPHNKWGGKYSAHAKPGGTKNRNMCGILVKAVGKIKKNAESDPNTEFVDGKGMLPPTLFLTSTCRYDYNFRIHA